MSGELAGNVLRFARVLRAAGMPVGTDRALRAVAALEVIGVARRDDVHAAMSAVMLDSQHPAKAVRQRILSRSSSFLNSEKTQIHLLGPNRPKPRPRCPAEP